MRFSPIKGSIVIDKERLDSALSAAASDLLAGRKARANIPYTPDIDDREFFKAVDAAAHAWAKTRGVELLCSLGLEAVCIALLTFSRNSPLRARERKPWHFMEVGEEKVLTGIKVPTIRVYVSLYAKNLGLLFSTKRLGNSSVEIRRLL
jgi:hypothetical protein